MEKRMVRVLLGLLALLFCAGQALAVPAAPATLYMPPSPDVDGVYKIVWSPVSGCNYVLQESKDGGAWATIFSGSNTYIYPPKRALGTYAYQVKAVNSTGSSLWKAGATTVTVGATTAQTTAPTSLIVPAATSTSATKITFGGAALGATYVLEQAVGTGAFTAVYTGTNGYYYTVGLVDGTTYAYRVKAKVAGYADSAYYPSATGSTLAVVFPQGAAACLACHDGSTLAPNTSGWSLSRHANADQKPAPGICDNCHNVNNVAGSTVAQISCQGCHGTATTDHPTNAYSVGVAVASCTNCHNSHVSAVGNIVTKVNAGKHAIGATTHSNSCGRCHSIEGYIAFDKGAESYSANSVTYYPGVINVSCAACHDSHGAGLRVPRGWNVGSAQYNLCTSCHNLTTAAGKPIASGLSVGVTGVEVATDPMQQHKKDWFRNIAATHYDLPTTGYGLKMSYNAAILAPTTIEGYTVRFDKETACTDCHGHEFLTETEGAAETPPVETIHTQWAQSGHAGKLLSAKIAKYLALGGYATRTPTNQALVMAEGATSATGDAWLHYDWDNSSGDASDRKGCQRCHTSTGVANYFAAPTTYSAVNNNFSHLAGWTANKKSGQNELLFCWGCHESVETGALRNPGAITVKSTGNPPVNTKATAAGGDVILPDAGKSNGCFGCHSGGGNMFSTWSSSRTPTHHGVAAATLYGPTTRIGYEFVGQNYANVPYFEHDQIGIANGSGPCVGCHMAGKDHHFEAVDTATSKINAQALCDTCHTPGSPYAMTFTKLEEEKAGYVAAGALLTAYINNSPANYKGVVIAGTVTAENDKAAWYNSKLFPADEGGAFVHNRVYTKRLMFDAIDWLQDGALNGTINTTGIETYTAALAWLGTTRP